MNRMKLGEILSVKHGWAFKGEYFAEDGEQSILTPGNFFEKGGFKPNGYVNDFTGERRHHEIYLSDPRKVAPEKCKTVIRHPIKKA